MCFGVAGAVAQAHCTMGGTHGIQRAGVACNLSRQRVRGRTLTGVISSQIRRQAVCNFAKGLDLA